MARAADRAYEAIRTAILDGDYGAGDRLPEEDLAELVGVSRTPVREALRRLAAEGIVEFQPNRGAFVAELSTREVREVFDLRAVLEGFAARLAARDVTPGDLDKLRALADEMEQLAASEAADRLDRIAELNTQFHAHVVQVADNRLLGSLVAGLVQVPTVHRTFHQYDDEGLARSMAHHRELIAALAAGDVNWAGTVMRSHVYAARVAIEQALGTGGEEHLDGVDPHG